MRSADITFVVLTRNEAANISACLHSLLPDSPKLVFDAGSDDGTVDAARAAGATVHVEPWRGFVPARTAAAALVTTPWTFMIDADERLTAELRYELHALNPASSVAAYSVPRRNWFMRKWVRGAGWWPDRLVRLFRTGQARAVGHLSPQGSTARSRPPGCSFPSASSGCCSHGAGFWMAGAGSISAPAARSTPR